MSDLQSILTERTTYTWTVMCDFKSTGKGGKRRKGFSLSTVKSENPPKITLVHLQPLECLSFPTDGEA